MKDRGSNPRQRVHFFLCLFVCLFVCLLSCLFKSITWLFPMFKYLFFSHLLLLLLLRFLVLTLLFSSLLTHLKSSFFLFFYYYYFSNFIIHSTLYLPLCSLSCVWGCSSDGRAFALHARGSGIDARHLHFFLRFIVIWGLSCFFLCWLRYLW